MIDLVRSWVIGVAGAAVLTGIALSLTPKGRVHNVLRFICGIVMVLALVSPVLDFDFEAYSINLSRYRDEAAAIETGATETTDRLSRMIIEEECRAYILDKAQVVGLDCTSVSVTVKWGDEGCWYPYEAHVEAQGPEGPKNSLMGLIESDLGIPRDRQYFS